MAKGDFLFTSESVTEGHSDKLADQISDAFLDAVLTQDKKCRVACETFVTAGLVMVGGEVTTTGYVDIDVLVRGVIKDAGYVDRSLGFTFDTCAILNAIGKQAPDIAQGVDKGGAGDQGLMTGFACRETQQLMPMPIMLAHGLTRRMAEVRTKGVLSYLRPDGKSQVTVEYRDGRPARVEAVVISAQHTEDILDRTGRQITGAARDEIIEKVAFEVIPRDMIDKKTKFFVNPTGKFVTGGPRSDVGLTGRKIIVDTYGGMASHGGGAFSGKDATKVDRSASYMARYIAKNVVASGLADKCTIQVAYAIGVAKPVSLMIFCDNTHKVPERRIVELIKKHFDLTPRGIIRTLDLTRPIFRKTATYGHFGRDGREFTWERTDVAKTLAKDA